MQHITIVLVLAACSVRLGSLHHGSIQRVLYIASLDLPRQLSYVGPLWCCPFSRDRNDFREGDLTFLAIFHNAN
ncbi:uncharacterized protein BT62DRAFT_930642 [Guyanagaster necrorhizus]|uniref:Secreted protein n=1 Tax=Guyanagaster necrorhizus TaxID=856835 RepID=A0A9P7VWU9_9AGAR|nr:uncharacterized protein BT62DRAFT_930642 [Guyanagaster necrorhizus MCA 3950]KAG7447629.1 hypothetical protein BT62DRAFT_930642 [Guyanagaster necrorhizus MCA 3950]